MCHPTFSVVVHLVNVKKMIWVLTLKCYFLDSFSLLFEFQFILWMHYLVSEIKLCWKVKDKRKREKEKECSNKQDMREYKKTFFLSVPLVSNALFWEFAVLLSLFDPFLIIPFFFSFCDKNLVSWLSLFNIKILNWFRHEIETIGSFPWLQLAERN